MCVLWVSVICMCVLRVSVICMYVLWVSVVYMCARMGVEKAEVALSAISFFEAVSLIKPKIL